MPVLEFSILIFAVIGKVFLSLFTLLKNTKSATNRLFFFFANTFAVYLLFNYLILQQTTPEGAFFWVKAVMTIAVLINFTFFLLATTFPRSDINLKTWKMKLYIVWTILMLPLAFLKLIFVSAPVVGAGAGEPGLAMPVFLLHTVISLGGGLISLVQKFRRSEGVEKAQIKLFLLGALFMFGALIVTNLLFVLIFGNASLIGLLPIYSLIFVGSISYAVVRHRFLDITLLVARTVSYTLLLFVLVVIYTSLIFATSELLPTGVNTSIVSVALALVVAFSFNPIRIFLQRVTDAFLFKGRYDTEELLGELTNIMASDINIESLSKKLLDTLLSKMRLTKGAFLLVEKQSIVQVKSKGFKEEMPLFNSSLAKLTCDDGKSYIFEGITNKGLKNLFRELDITVALPLKVKNNVIGVFVVGSKASGEVYNNEDIEVLEIFASQVAVALQNAQSYQAIQEFSRTLERKVEERTKQLKETQARELEKAKELLKLKDEFVFIASHDLRSPVTAIKGYLQLITKNGEKFSKDTNDNFAAISQSSNRLNQLVNDLLEVARSESGTIKVRVVPTDIVQITQNAIRQAKPSVDKKEIKVNFDFDERHKTVLGDSEKLSEVMENLLSNAVKFNKDGGKINIKTAKEEDNLKVTVADTGYGIPEDKKEKVFSKFFKGRTESTLSVPGTGLGLFVVRMLIQKMKGKIIFESKEGEGTTFTFWLPLAKTVVKGIDAK